MGRDLFLLLSKGEGLVSAGFKGGRTGFGWFRVGRTGFVWEGLVSSGFGSFRFLVTTRNKHLCLHGHTCEYQDLDLGIFLLAFYRLISIFYFHTFYV